MFWSQPCRKNWLTNSGWWLAYFDWIFFSATEKCQNILPQWTMISTVFALHTFSIFRFGAHWTKCVQYIMWTYILPTNLCSKPIFSWYFHEKKKYAEKNDSHLDSNTMTQWLQKNHFNVKAAVKRISIVYSKISWYNQHTLYANR